MTDETCKGCGAIVELDELRRDQLLECGECVTASNKLRRQLTAARKRIAELEKTRTLLVEAWRVMDLVMPNDDITVKVEAYLMQEATDAKD